MGSRTVRIRFNRATLLWVAGSVIIAATLAVWFQKDVHDSPAFLFWVSTFSGNWSSSSKDDVDKLWFALSVVCAMVLNIGTIAGVFVLLSKILIVVERIQPVELTSAFMLRDRSIKEEIFNALSGILDIDIINSVEKAFEEGTKIWANEQLPEILGPDAAGDVIRRMREQGLMPK